MCTPGIAFVAPYGFERPIGLITAGLPRVYDAMKIAHLDGWRSQLQERLRPGKEYDRAFLLNTEESTWTPVNASLVLLGIIISKSS